MSECEITVGDVLSKLKGLPTSFNSIVKIKIKKVYPISRVRFILERWLCKV